MSHQYWNLKQIVESQNYPFTMGQLRHLLHFRHRNGLENATRKNGKRLFLRIDLFGDSKKQTISEEEKEQIETAVVEELNQILAIVHTSTTHILIEKGDNEFVLDSKSSLLTLYQNQLVCVGDKALNKATIWLNSPKRRTFDKIVFNPRIEGHYEGNYNIWKGFAVTPKQGDCSLFWLHVKQVICTYNEGHL